MSLDVALVRPGRRNKDKGRVEIVGVHADDDGSFDRACEAARTESRVSTRTPMLARTSSWGTLVLTAEDMEQLVAEVRILAADGGPSYLEPILRLAGLCAAEPGLELHIDGD